MKCSKPHRLRDHVIKFLTLTFGLVRSMQLAFFEKPDMKKEQQGFTLIELMNVVAIIGILTAIAIPAYQRYTIRAQVAEGLNLSAAFKTAVTEFISSNGAFPTDNADAGLSAPGSYVGKYVNSVSVNGAVVSIQYGNDAHAQISGQTVILTAMNNGGSTSWTCTTGGVIPSIYLPSACR